MHVSFIVTSVCFLGLSYNESEGIRPQPQFGCIFYFSVESLSKSKYGNDIMYGYS